jgi:peptidoglycan/xylan/chitin deacetylase (PgdA/CDA1 family)
LVCHGGSHALGDCNLGFVRCLRAFTAQTAGHVRVQRSQRLGLARTVEVDTTGGPGFGFEHYKAHDFLVLNEVVLTFDDGPWPGNTPAVLAALAHHCTKATFFPVGKHALWHPEILKQVAAAGHTIGGHTWSHANLAGAKTAAKRAKGAAEPESSLHDRGVEEIEKGFSAVKLALGGPPAPFFRFPFLKDPKDQLEYLGSRNIAVFSTDLDSFDFKGASEDIIVGSRARLERRTARHRSDCTRLAERPPGCRTCSSIC